MDANRLTKKRTTRLPSFLQTVCSFIQEINILHPASSSVCFSLDRIKQIIPREGERKRKKRIERDGEKDMQEKMLVSAPCHIKHPVELGRKSGILSLQELLTESIEEEREREKERVLELQSLKVWWIGKEHLNSWTLDVAVAQLYWWLTHWR